MGVILAGLDGGEDAKVDDLRWAVVHPLLLERVQRRVLQHKPPLPPPLKHSALLLQVTLLSRVTNDHCLMLDTHRSHTNTPQHTAADDRGEEGRGASKADSGRGRGAGMREGVRGRHSRRWAGAGEQPPAGGGKGEGYTVAEAAAPAPPLPVLCTALLPSSPPRLLSPLSSLPSPLSLSVSSALLPCSVWPSLLCCSASVWTLKGRGEAALSAEAEANPSAVLSRNAADPEHPDLPPSGSGQLQPVQPSTNGSPTQRDNPL